MFYMICDQTILRNYLYPEKDLNNIQLLIEFFQWLRNAMILIDSFIFILMTIFENIYLEREHLSTKVNIRNGRVVLNTNILPWHNGDFGYNIMLTIWWSYIECNNRKHYKEWKYEYSHACLS